MPGNDLGGLAVARVNSWPDALAHCAAPTWESVTLDAAGALTTHLSARCSNLYVDWNQVITQSKTELIAPIVEPAIQAAMNEFQLTTAFADCVRWDIVHAAAESAYEHCHPPRFFCSLLAVYQKGHFPCGWQGDWPVGRLEVF